MSDTGTRGVSTLVGTVLLVGIVLTGAVGTIAVGAPALAEFQGTASDELAEKAFGVLAERSEHVGAGRSPARETTLPRMQSGAYELDQDAGRLRIVHHNRSGNGSVEELYDARLGAVHYTRDASTVTYQAGGIWRETESGSVVSVAPPVSYRDATLSMRVFRVRGSGQMQGGRARVERPGPIRTVYPNASTAAPNGAGSPYDESGDTYANPLTNGSVEVTVQGATYEGWATVFRDRTGAPVTVDDENRTASVRLDAAGARGAFDVPLDGESMELRGLGSGHPVQRFAVTLYPDDADSASFSNLKWSLYAENGSERFELHLRAADTADCGDPVNATLYHADGSGTYHGWHDDSAFTIDCGDRDGDGDTEASITANFTTDDPLTYQSLSSSDLLHYNPDGKLADPGELDRHEGEVDWEPQTVTAGDQMSFRNATGHYLPLLGRNVELTVVDSGGGGASSSVNEDLANGTVEYTSDSVLTYLHVTETTLDVEFDE